MRSFKLSVASLFNKSLSVVADYPWLWAISREWKDWSGGYEQLIPKVSRNMEDLRLVLLQDSDGTPFKLWAFLKTGSNLEIQLVKPQEKCDWAGALAVHIIPKITDILNLAMEVPDQGGSWPSLITIFEHPGKKSLNQTLQAIFNLQGSRPYHWARG